MKTSSAQRAFVPDPDYRPGFLRIMARIGISVLVLAAIVGLDYWVITELILAP